VTVLYRKIAGSGQQRGISQLRAFMHALSPAPAAVSAVRCETANGDERQLQVDWSAPVRQHTIARRLRDLGLQLHQLCRVRQQYEGRDSIAKKKAEGMDSWTIRSRLRRTTRLDFEYRK